MRCEVQSLLVAVQDVGGNHLPPPSDATFVLIEPIDGSSLTVTALDGITRQLNVTRSGGQMKVTPFVIVSTTAGMKDLFTVTILAAILHHCMIEIKPSNAICQHVLCITAASCFYARSACTVDYSVCVHRCPAHAAETLQE